MARIAICLPNSYEAFDREFTMSMFGVISSFYVWNASIGNKHVLQIFVGKEGYIDTLRESLAISALEWKADYVLFCDTDQLFPPDMIERMMEVFEKNKKVEAVSGLYTFKSLPFLPHCYEKYDPEIDKFTLLAGFPTNQLFPVQGAGFGCLMMKSSVIKKVSQPRFVMKIGEFGEDLYFCRRFIQENGRPIKMFIHPGIVSKHMTKITVDINTYVNQNKIKIENNVLRPTPEQVDLISDFQDKLMGKFLSSPLGKKKLDKKK